MKIQIAVTKAIIFQNRTSDNRSNVIFDCLQVENIAYRKEVWTNERKPVEVRSKKNIVLKTRSLPFVSLVHDGHASSAVDGDEDNVLENCALIDNYYTERPVLVIDLAKLSTIGGIIIKTWQGKGQGLF
jgi:hypothetical protein